ncbi:MAG: shikimate kinase [Candidatus Eremiobacter antarcticus]|nr:shikimate kinase [Candidatus Eremiobacteraeota bacterium]MBC5808886.1 shikimate kinase [Candidatus Eremiobacteraeota bacterium]PZR60429.1 MAG: shikimate kinase [Candidatus Eremiobacter sp. RRmetagenome_bin22]
MTLALTGFMGTGKSTTGKRVARILRLPFLDTDDEVARRHGPIQTIFQTEGEPAFRLYEAAVIEELTADPKPCVLAVGGGAVLEARNRARLRGAGLVVHLAASPGTILRRVAHRSHRPLLGARPDIAVIAQLLEARAFAYADCDLSVPVDRKPPSAVAEIIARWYTDIQARGNVRS